jgi:RHS repeat-associated protein
MTYDGENRLLTFTSGGTTAAYDYDGEGRRVRKTVTGAGTTVFVYDAAGLLAMEMAPAGSDPDTGTRYLTADHLGSTRAVTDGNGALVDRWDYFPYGQTIPTGQSFGNRNLLAGYQAASGVDLEFTGKERDAESGLDYFGARYYSGAQGRFTSSDPLSGTVLHVLNPQRWNMYAYAVNNPLTYVDPDGRDAIAVVYSKMAVHMGHAGVASVHGDGKGTYADFGPKNGPRPIGEGKYNFIDYKTQIQYGAGGRPTTASLTSLANELADDEQQPRDSVSVYYFKTSDAETAALDAFINQAKNRQSQGDVPHYVTGISDCIGFCARGLSQAHVGSSAPFFSIPNLYTLDFILNPRMEGGATGTPKPKEKVKSKICYTDESGKKACQQ